MIDILWKRQMLTMFAIDVTAGCKEIADAHTAGSVLDQPPRDGDHSSTRKRR